MAILPASARSHRFPSLTVICLLAATAFTAAQTAAVPPAIPGNGYRVAGTVVSKTDGHPLARARVTLRDAKDSQKFESLVTAEDGRFDFPGVPAGKYSLNGAKRGFITAAYDQHEQFSTAIVTGAGIDTEALVLRMAPAAIISGKILDESGDPVRHASVTLYQDDHSTGVDQIHQVRGAQTDDQGEYEIPSLMPGTYFLSATAKPWYAIHPHSDPKGSRRKSQQDIPENFDQALDVAYPLTYYPDATEAESASPIPIRGGEHLQLEIHLNPVPSLHLLFRVSPNGDNSYHLPQLEQTAFEGSSFLQTESHFVSPGLFEIAGVPAGRYNIRINRPGSSSQMNAVELTKDGEEIDTSSAEAMSTVKLSVQVPGSSLPERLTVGLRSAHRMLAGAWKVVDAKGEAELQQIPAGRYDIAVWGPPRPYSIRKMSAEGATVSGHSLIVAAGSSPSVSLSLVAGSSNIEGTAKRAGKPFAGAMVVLVPKDPELNRDLFRRDQSDLDGTFNLRNVVPGSYTLVAIEDGWDLDWSQPAVIAGYLGHGRATEVGNPVGRNMNLSDAVEVQSK
jgi:5-hydroxyisourate hydrolase-like protein (transthyretin family)